MLRTRTPPIPGRVPPCLPTAGQQPPAGPGWIHEIKHDGFRLMARRVGGRIQLFTRNGYDWRDRYPQIAAALAVLPVRSCLLDGEAVACDGNGLSVFDLLRYRRADGTVALCAFDLIELDGKDLRRAPIEERKATLARLLRRPLDGIVLNEHFDGDGPTIFEHACRLGSAAFRWTQFWTQTGRDS
jgi:bifunctional non-homologous end joining protein LigD